MTRTRGAWHPRHSSTELPKSPGQQVEAQSNSRAGTSFRLAQIKRQERDEIALIPFDACWILPESGQGLERLHVGSLPALGPLHYVELHGLTFLQTLETARVDRRGVHEDIFAVLARDKAEALRVINPLHSTLFHFARISWSLNCAG